MTKALIDRGPVQINIPREDFYGEIDLGRSMSRFRSRRPWNGLPAAPLAGAPTAASGDWIARGNRLAAAQAEASAAGRVKLNTSKRSSAPVLDSGTKPSSSIIRSLFDLSRTYAGRDDGEVGEDLSQEPEMVKVITAHRKTFLANRSYQTKVMWTPGPKVVSDAAFTCMAAFVENLNFCAIIPV